MIRPEPVLYRPLRAAVALVAASIMMVGCANAPAPAHEVYTSVKTVVPVSCVPDALGAAPSGLLTPARLAAIPDGPSRYVAMTEDWLLRVARMNDTEPVITACKTAAPAP